MRVPTAPPRALCPRSVSVSTCPPPGAALLPSQPPSAQPRPAHLSCSWRWHFHPPPPSSWSQRSESHSRRLSLPLAPNASPQISLPQSVFSGVSLPSPRLLSPRRRGSLPPNHRSFLLASSLSLPAVPYTGFSKIMLYLYDSVPLLLKNLPWLPVALK